MRSDAMIRVIPVVLMFGLCVSGCGRDASSADQSAGAAAAAPAAPPALVRVEVIREEPVAPEFRATGNVRPRHYSIVASGADGVVAEFPVE
ncbi:MAG: hypothetical protein ACKPJD_35585, partial [Planctomycetaceae bacterium]